MSEQRQAQDVAEARALRNEAWGLIRGNVAHVREGLDGKRIASRIKERATDEVVEAVDQAREVATEHKAVVAGTILALAGWFLREPIVALANRLLALVDDDAPLAGDPDAASVDDSGELE